MFLWAGIKLTVTLPPDIAGGAGPVIMERVAERRSRSYFESHPP